MRNLNLRPLLMKLGIIHKHDFAMLGVGIRSHMFKRNADVVVYNFQCVTCGEAASVTADYFWGIKV